MEIPAHSRPHTKTECLATWKSRGRIPVPTKSGTIMDILIVHLIEATAIDGIPVDLIIEARATHRAPLKKFAVVFASMQPADNYPIPTLRICEGEGVWLAVP